MTYKEKVRHPFVNFIKNLDKNEFVKNLSSEKF